jgi:hypothetical protein
MPIVQCARAADLWNERMSGHTKEQDFEHFLHYSGHANLSADKIDLMREAYFAAWDPGCNSDAPARDHGHPAGAMGADGCRMCRQGMA